MNKTIAAAFAAMLFTISGPALAQDVVVDHDNMVSVLSGYHGMPGADYWARLEPEQALETLMNIANDPAVFTVVRARALSALTHFKNEAVTNLLVDKARNDKVAYMRSAAYEAIAKAEGPAATASLAEALKDTDVMVRLTAVRSLRKIGTPEAKAALRTGIEIEKNPTARSVMTSTLEQMK